mgnify:CR=1 FL=1
MPRFTPALAALAITFVLLFAACDDSGGSSPTPTPDAPAVRLGAPPAYPDGDEALRTAPDLFAQVRLLVAGRLLRIARAEALEAAIRACAR